MHYAAMPDTGRPLGAEYMDGHRDWDSPTLKLCLSTSKCALPCNLSVTVSVKNYSSAAMSSAHDEAGEKYCAHRGPYRNDDTANDTRG